MIKTYQELANIFSFKDLHDSIINKNDISINVYDYFITSLFVVSELEINFNEIINVLESFHISLNSISCEIQRLNIKNTESVGIRPLDNFDDSSQFLNPLEIINQIRIIENEIKKTPDKMKEILTNLNEKSIENKLSYKKIEKELIKIKQLYQENLYIYEEIKIESLSEINVDLSIVKNDLIYKGENAEEYSRNNNHFCKIANSPKKIYIIDYYLLSILMIIKYANANASLLPEEEKFLKYIDYGIKHRILLNIQETIASPNTGDDAYKNNSYFSLSFPKGSAISLSDLINKHLNDFKPRYSTAVRTFIGDTNYFCITKSQANSLNNKFKFTDKKLKSVEEIIDIINKHYWSRRKSRLVSKIGLWIKLYNSNIRPVTHVVLNKHLAKAKLKIYDVKINKSKLKEEYDLLKDSLNKSIDELIDFVKSISKKEIHNIDLGEPILEKQVEKKPEIEKKPTRRNSEINITFPFISKKPTLDLTLKTIEKLEILQKGVLYGTPDSLKKRDVSNNDIYNIIVKDLYSYFVYEQPDYYVKIKNDILSFLIVMKLSLSLINCFPTRKWYDFYHSISKSAYVYLFYAAKISYHAGVEVISNYAQTINEYYDKKAVLVNRSEIGSQIKKFIIDKNISLYNVKEAQGKHDKVKYFPESILYKRKKFKTTLGITKISNMVSFIGLTSLLLENKAKNESYIQLIKSYKNITTNEFVSKTKNLFNSLNEEYSINSYYSQMKNITPLRDIFNSLFTQSNLNLSCTSKVSNKLQCLKTCEQEIFNTLIEYIIFLESYPNMLKLSKEMIKIENFQVLNSRYYFHINILDDFLVRTFGLSECTTDIKDYGLLYNRFYENNFKSSIKERIILAFKHIKDLLIVNKGISDTNNFLSANSALGSMTQETDIDFRPLFKEFMYKLKPQKKYFSLNYDNISNLAITANLYLNRKSKNKADINIINSLFSPLFLFIPLLFFAACYKSGRGATNQEAAIDNINTEIKPNELRSPSERREILGLVLPFLWIVISLYKLIKVQNEYAFDEDFYQILSTFSIKENFIIEVFDIIKLISQLE